MRSSRVGVLLSKLDSSGINGSPIISDAELQELREGLMEFQNEAIDWRDMPLFLLIGLDIGKVEGVIEARKS